MRIARLVPRLCVVLAAVAVAGCPLGCRSGNGDHSPAARPERLVVVSYDGVGADLASEWVRNGSAMRSDGLLAFADRDGRLPRMRTVDPTLTAVIHATLLTAAPPSATGIVSNRFVTAGAPLTDSSSGFTAPWQVEPLWTTVRRAGRRVGVLLWPGSDPTSLDRMGDFGMWWPTRPLAEAEILELDPAHAVPALDLPSQDGLTGLKWKVEIELSGSEPPVASLEVAVADTEPDGRPRFDSVAFRPFGADGWELRDDRGWYRLGVDALGPEDLGPARYASWCKVLYLDRWQGGLRLYRGAPWRLLAYPSDFAAGLETAIGPWPGIPDDDHLRAWWLDASEGIDLDAWLEQAERLDRWLDDALEFALAHEHFDLLLGYHPIADEYQHTSLVVAPGQWPWSPGKAVASREGLKRVGRSVDRSVAATWAGLDPQRDAFVVVSDHGLAPVVREVRIHRLLADHGLTVLETDGDGGRRIGAASEVVAAPEAAVAHLYLNVIGARPEGTVEAAATDQLLRQVARLLADLEADGEPLVERVVTRAEAAALGLDHPSSGDLIAFLAPGSTWSRSFDEPVIAPTTTTGQHGYLASHAAMDGLFAARGGGVPPRMPARLTAVEAGRWLRRWAGVDID